MRELAYPLNATIFSIPPIFHSVIDKPEMKSYVRKNSHTASFAKNKMPNTTGKSYARKRNSNVHQ